MRDDTREALERAVAIAEELDTAMAKFIVACISGTEAIGAMDAARMGAYARDTMRLAATTLRVAIRRGERSEVEV